MSFPELNREIRGHDFYPANLDTIPALYETEGKPLGDKIVHARYFVRGGTGEWLIFEIERDTDVQALAFAWCDLGFGEFGYVDLVALESVLIDRPSGAPALVERDLDWTPRPWREVER